MSSWPSAGGDSSVSGMSEFFEDAARDWIAERRAVGRTISMETAKAYRGDLASWKRYLEAQLGAVVRVQDLDGAGDQSCTGGDEQR